ncbi:MAG: efflux RND transporter permease subunit, partial [Pseudomonadota bacterium]
MRTLFYRLPRLSVLVLLVIVAGGLGAVLSLGRQEDPTLVERYGYVLTVLPGADAERMEALVSDPMESALMELPEIVEVDSTSRAGVSQVSIDIREDLTPAEVDDAWTLIRAKVDEVTVQLPAGTRAPIVERVIVGAHTMIVELIWEGEGAPELTIMSRLASDLADRFQNIPATEEVEIYGQPQEEIRVVMDPESLAAAGLDLQTAASLIGAADSKTPAGNLRAGNTNIGIDVDGAFGSISRVRSVPLVQSANGDTLRVGDVADVQKGFQEPIPRLVIHNNQRAITVAAIIEPNRRVDLWAEQAAAMVAEFSDNAPRGIQVVTVFNQSTYTMDRLGQLAQNLVFSALIVFLVLFFVMGWRAALIVGTALPLTICLVLILFNMFNLPLHQMSVTGLVISLGLLIDNAIVVVDEFDQKRATGMGRIEAIDSSLSHLFGPLFASTLTTALAFTPIALLPGGSGEFVGMIGVSVIFAVISSFLISMTVIPALSGWFDRKRAGELPGEVKRRWWRDGIAIDAVSDGYRYTVGAVLRFPPLGLAIGIVPALIGFWLAGQLPAQFFPPTERDQFQISLRLPAESSIKDTIETTRRVTDLLLARPEVTDVNMTLGQPSPRVYYNVFNNSRGVEGIASGWAQ